MYTFTNLLSVCPDPLVDHSMTSLLFCTCAIELDIIFVGTTCRSPSQPTLAWLHMKLLDYVEIKKFKEEIGIEIEQIIQLC